MPSTFGIFEVAKSALRASQTVTQVIGHNVANVNTPGYSRQTAQLAARDANNVTPLSTLGVDQVGTGVDVTDITAVRDRFVDAQIEVVRGSQGEATTLQGMLQQVQSAYSEPGDGGLASGMTAFFNSWQDVAQSPEQPDIRSTVLQQGQSLAGQFHTVQKALGDVQTQIQGQVSQQVDQVNKLAAEVADLNKQIRYADAVGNHPNDLVDKRAEDVRHLADLIGARSQDELDVNGKPTDTITVTVAGQTIVSGTNSYSVPATYSMKGEHAYLGDGIAAVNVPGGSIGGLIHASGKVGDYLSGLNTVASHLIAAVNGIHSTGYGLDNATGRPFFTGTDASDIAIAPDVAGNPDAVAAASPPISGQTVAPGNGDIARAIADLANSPAIGDATIGQFYAQQVSQVGADAKDAQQRTADLKTASDQLTQLRNTTSGVSIDDEMANLIQYQRSYQAAAKLLSTMDTMLDNLLSSL